MSETLSVIVPTFRRTEFLAKCLAGLMSQRRVPDEVLIAVHVSDMETVAYVEDAAARWPAIIPVGVERHGTVAAQNRALLVARSSIVAFCDDDAVPHEDWTERILSSFAEDPRVAGVGGRDLILADGSVSDVRAPVGWRRHRAPDVGRVNWFGRMVGNHHLPGTRRCETDVLKGVNMAFRRECVVGHGFDERLMGDGAIVHSEPSICLPLRSQGFRIIYDPAILVDHRPALRSRGEQRHDERPHVIAMNSHNEALAILDYMGPAGRMAFMVWGLLLGARSVPGLAQTARDVAVGRPDAWERFLAAQRGRAWAWRTHRSSERAQLTGQPAAGAPLPSIS